jgi:hypothetical protein
MGTRNECASFAPIKSRQTNQKYPTKTRRIRYREEVGPVLPVGQLEKILVTVQDAINIMNDNGLKIDGFSVRKFLKRSN